MKVEDNTIHTIEELKQFMLPEYVLEIIERLQQEAFMNGYQYAISLLEESMIRKDR